MVTQGPAEAVVREAATDRERFYEFVRGIEPSLTETLKALQPYVVLFSLSVVVATFTKDPFPEASSWALVAAFGFGWALVSAAAVAALRRRSGLIPVMFRLHALFGVLLGFLSLGLTLLYMLLGNALLTRAVLFIILAAISVTSLLWFYETWDFVRRAYRRAREQNGPVRGWYILAWSNMSGIAFAIVAPGMLFWDMSPVGLEFLILVWLVGLALVATARGIVARLQKR